MSDSDRPSTPSWLWKATLKANIEPYKFKATDIIVTNIPSKQVSPAMNRVRDCARRMILCEAGINAFCYSLILKEDDLDENGNISAVAKGRIKGKMETWLKNIVSLPVYIADWDTGDDAFHLMPRKNMGQISKGNVFLKTKVHQLFLLTVHKRDAETLMCSLLICYQKEWNQHGPK